MADVRQAFTTPMNGVTIGFRSGGTNYYTQRTFQATPEWHRHSIPLGVPAAALSETQCRIEISTSSYDWSYPDTTDPSDPIRTNVRVGRLMLVSGRSAVGYGHIRTMGDGSWNGGHIVMGGVNGSEWHLFVDSAGRLRIRDGEPNGDLDGTIVGTQS
jgi:hypothetical protein